MDYFHNKFYLKFQGRPKGVTPKYSLKPLVPRLSELLGVEVCYDMQDLSANFKICGFFCVAFVTWILMIVCLIILILG